MTDKKELDPAKVENEANRKKVKLEDKLADFESPEELRKNGADVNPTTTVVSNQPEPANADEYKGTRYDGKGGK